jgi:hypothetical protein
MKVLNVPQVYDHQNPGNRDILKLLYAIFERLAVLEHWEPKACRISQMVTYFGKGNAWSFHKTPEIEIHQFAQFPK